MEDDAMAKPMFPSEDSLTDGQIGKFQEIIGAALRKRRTEFLSAPAQIVLTIQAQDLQKDTLALFRKLVDAVGNIIVRHVKKVDRKLTPQQVLDATGRKQYVTNSVVETMPRGVDDEKDIYFFPVCRYVSDDEAEKEYALRGFKPADPYSVARVNIDDPVFADTHPNGTHWKDADGNWCYAAFHRLYDERYVSVYRDDYGWRDRWWFAGVPK